MYLGEREEHYCPMGTSNLNHWRDRPPLKDNHPKEKGRGKGGGERKENRRETGLKGAKRKEKVGRK